MTGNPDSRLQDYRAHAVMDQALMDLSNNCRRPSFLKGLLQKVECHGGKIMHLTHIENGSKIVLP